MKTPLSILLTLTLLVACYTLSAQDLYSARAYWEEVNKASFRLLKEKQLRGDSLTDKEATYVRDYEQYLLTYYSHMDEVEKQKYEQMKAPWEQQRVAAAAPGTEKDFELRPRDRFRNGIYGLYYGATLVSIADMTGGAAAGVPLIMAGIWQLGPVLNPRKYEGINIGVIRAGNTGKILGLGYGLGLGLAVVGDGSSNPDFMLGLSTLSSIALGEIAFQKQKTHPVAEGHIEMVRHYGFLVPIVAAVGIASTGETSSNATGASIVAGGIVGLMLGNSVAKRYPYTVGDSYAVSSLTWISSGLGLSAMITAYENNTSSKELFLIPAATAIAGTLWGQGQVKGVHLSQQQGSTLSLASGGAALIGLGITTLAQTETTSIMVLVPSALALTVHQVVFAGFRKKNQVLRSENLRKDGFRFALNVSPENYFVGRQAPQEVESSWPPQVRPIATVRITF